MPSSGRYFSTVDARSSRVHAPRRHSTRAVQSPVGRSPGGQVFSIVKVWRGRSRGWMTVGATEGLMDQAEVRAACEALAEELLEALGPA